MLRNFYRIRFFMYVARKCRELYSFLNPSPPSPDITITIEPISISEDSYDSNIHNYNYYDEY